MRDGIERVSERTRSWSDKAHIDTTREGERAERERRSKREVSKTKREM